jgi:serine/threonine-protein kinase
MASSKIRRNPSRDLSSTLRYGDKLGKYLVTGFAGKGATSHVYRARRQSSFEPVAIKVLHPHLVAEPAKRRKFFSEARLMLRMEHPNVVEFHEILETDGKVAFVMDYIDGTTLDDFLAEQTGPMDEETLAMLFIDVLRGVAHAHQKGVIHRDLKPANIMITESQGRYCAKLLDFGVARFADEDPHPEDKKKIVGTAAYISPEEVEDPEAVDQSSDLYSLGVMLYEAACGRRPFGDANPRQLLYAHARQQPPEPSQFNPNISPAFEQIILKTLQKSPDGRFDSAGEMIDALEGAIRRMFEARANMPSIDQMAETTEWSREVVPDEIDEEAEEAGEPAYLYMLMCLKMALTALAATGHTGRPDDPHHLNRQEPPFGY